MKMIKNKRISSKSTVAVISSSWGGPHLFPKVFNLGLQRLKDKFGFNIKEYPCTRASQESLYSHPEERAKDIMSAFKDPEVKLIIASIGGSDSIRILPFLDIDTIKRNPKPVMGFSDTTTLLTYLNQQGIITMHGPSVMAGFAEPGVLQEEFTTHVNNFFFGEWNKFEYKSYSKWTEESGAWKDDNYFETKKKYSDSEGWKAIQGEGVFNGNLYGGSLEIFEMMKGTPFMEKVEHLDNTLLFLETSEEKPTVSYVTYALRSMGMRGAFDRISGLLIGRPKSYSDDEKEKLYKAIKKVVSLEFNKPLLPIIVNLDFGHTQPQWILPLGVNAEFNIEEKTFKLTESPFDN